MFYWNRVSVCGHYQRWSTNFCQVFRCNVRFVEPQPLCFLEYNREVSGAVGGAFVVAPYKSRHVFPEGLLCEGSDPVQIFWRLGAGIEEPADTNKTLDQVRSRDRD